MSTVWPAVAGGAMPVTWFMTSDAINEPTMPEAGPSVAVDAGRRARAATSSS